MAVIKVCEHCKQNFTIPNRRSESVKYCSRTCKTEAGWVDLVCKTCGETFRRKKSDMKRSDNDYCSRICYHADRIGTAHKVDPNSVRYYRVCETCKKDFRVTETRKDVARWCSKECQSASPSWAEECSKRQLDEKHWRWSGGVYKNHEGYIRSQPMGRSRSLEHRRILFDAMLLTEPNHHFIIEVDGVKKLNPEIEVHHIDKVRSNNVLDNLLAITKDAHAQIHHRNRKPRPWECWPSNPERW